MDEDIKKFFDEESKKIKHLENLVSVFLKEKIIVSDGVPVGHKMTSLELKDVVEIESRIMTLKRRRHGFPKELC